MDKDKIIQFEMIEVSNEYFIAFIGAKDHNVTKFSLEGHKVTYIGKLNSFNKIKVLRSWREKNVDLVAIFSNVLKNRGFDTSINPSAYLCKYVATISE